MIYNGYDNLNRLITKGGSTIADVTNGYDNFNNLISASHALAAVSWTYDALGRVLTEVQPNGTVSYVYDTAGRRTQLTYPGSGFYTNYQYYDDGRLKLVGLNGATTGSNVLATYYDDQLGRRASMCRGTGTTSSCSSVARTTWSYDAISRLSGLSHDLTTGGSTNDLSRTFSYSPASQLITRTATTALYEPIYGTTYTDAYVANGLNQYTSVAGAGLTYDGRGNTTNDTTKGYSYDGLNRLVSATNGASLAYDPTGRLMSVTLSGTTTKFLYDGTRLIAEYNGSNTLLRRYVHGDGVDDPIVWYDSSGTTNKRNLFKDERGSVVAADTGSAVTTIKYDEYGNPSVTGSTVPRFQYTGQAWLSEIGLYYYKARIYNPDLGRFMQADPIGYEDQMNLYAYVGNDPMNKTDPTGLCEDGDLACIVQNFLSQALGRETAVEAAQSGQQPWDIAKAAAVDKAIEIIPTDMSVSAYVEYEGVVANGKGAAAGGYLTFSAVPGKNDIGLFFTSRMAQGLDWSLGAGAGIVLDTVDGEANSVELDIGPGTLELGLTHNARPLVGFELSISPLAGGGNAGQAKTCTTTAANCAQ